MQYAVSRDRSAWACSLSSLSVVFLKGAQGNCSFAINGPYVCTFEDGIGPVLYSKLGDGSMCIERYDAMDGLRVSQRVWQVKPVFYKGKDICMAEVKRNSVYLSQLEKCISNQWSVGAYDLNGKLLLEQQPSVRMVTGAYARREVSSP